MLPRKTVTMSGFDPMVGFTNDADSSSTSEPSKLLIKLPPQKSESLTCLPMVVARLNQLGLAKAPLLGAL